VIPDISTGLTGLTRYQGSSVCSENTVHPVNPVEMKEKIRRSGLGQHAGGVRT
jgi:hypothetical protein